MSGFAYRKQRQRGFTLVEVLVVMTLLSLVVLALGSALRTTAQTEERVDQRLARNDEIRVVTGFLQSVLGRISGQKRQGITSADENLFLLIPYYIFMKFFLWQEIRFSILHKR